MREFETERIKIVQQKRKDQNSETIFVIAFIGLIDSFLSCVLKLVGEVLTQMANNFQHVIQQQQQQQQQKEKAVFNMLLVCVCTCVQRLHDYDSYITTIILTL